MTTIVRELPWERLTLAHLGYATLIQLALLLVVAYFFYAALVPEKFRGALLMRPKLKHPNYPFYFVAAIWAFMLWLMINRVNSDFFFWSHTDLPQEIVEDLIMRSVLGSTANFTLSFMAGVVALLNMFHRQEIREKGLKNGFGFFPWELIEQAKWIGPGEIRFYYRVPKHRFFSFSAHKEAFEEEFQSFLWEMTPDQEAEARQELEAFLPGRIE